MGFASPAPPGALWRQHRHHFPVTNNLIYLNHAGVSPLCGPAARAMRALLDDVAGFGSHHYPTWMDAYEGLRVAAARLIGAHRDEIAIVKNTSEGIATIALGLDWRAGDRVVAFQEEFPANVYPWQRLAARGVTVEWLSEADPLERVEEACRGARLLAISFVQYLSGRRADLQALGEICRRRDCLFFVDAIQGLGAFPLDVRACGIHALAADGHKWLMGPEGCGVLFLQREWQDRVEPVEFGYTNVRHFHDYGRRDMTLRPDAGRYECGTLNTAGVFGLRAAIEYILSIGVDDIGREVRALADRLATGAEAKGYALPARRTPQTGAGIVSIRHPERPGGAVLEHLRRSRIEAALRSGWVRMSPHFYLSPAEIDAVIAALP